MIELVLIGFSVLFIIFLYCGAYGIILVLGTILFIVGLFLIIGSIIAFYKFCLLDKKTVDNYMKPAILWILVVGIICTYCGAKVIWY